jgi:hypothetical protein
MPRLFEAADQSDEAATRVSRGCVATRDLLEPISDMALRAGLLAEAGGVLPETGALSDRGRVALGVPQVTGTSLRGLPVGQTRGDRFWSASSAAVVGGAVLRSPWDYAVHFSSVKPIALLYQRWWGVVGGVQVLPRLWDCLCARRSSIQSLPASYAACALRCRLMACPAPGRT